MCSFHDVEEFTTTHHTLRTIPSREVAPKCGLTASQPNGSIHNLSFVIVRDNGGFDSHASFFRALQGRFGGQGLWRGRRPRREQGRGLWHGSSKAPTNGVRLDQLN